MFTESLAGMVGSRYGEKAGKEGCGVYPGSFSFIPPPDRLYRLRASCST